MVWLPARPSPIAAPIAPPPRASPPPTRAPAMPIAPATVCPAIVYSSWLVLLRSLEYRGLLLFLLLVLFLVLFLVARGHVEVDDREQHEDVRLDQADGEIEGLPDDLEGAEGLGGEGGHDDDDESSGEEVAEESKCQRDGLGDLFDEVDRRQPSGRLGVVLEVAADSSRAQRLDVHPHDDEQREREGQVHVAR